MKIINKAKKLLREQRGLVFLALLDAFNRKRRVAASKPYWKDIKGIHSGRRGFVIGNGPSLLPEDLEKLKDEISIASNKIYLCFDQLEWRPDYFTVVDPFVWQRIRAEVGQHVSLVHLPDSLLGIPRSLRDKTVFWHTPNYASSSDAYNFSDNLEEGAYGGATVTYENLQLAVHLGLNPIYIIGCDHYFTEDINGKQGDLAVAGKESNHFIKGYLKPGDKVYPADIDVMNKSYQQAQRFAAENGVSIFNATRGGHLEVFERANLDEVIANKV
jgi:hypothetical protein